jgi:CTP:molybdopterin cytidylyltransferase MocA
VLVPGGVAVIAGLILAAGEGSRFGSSPKLVAQFRGRPLLEHAVLAMNAVPELERVIVVLGAHASAVSAAVDFGRAETVVCAQWRHGQSASLRCGVEALAGAERIIVTLGDEPLVSTQTIALMAEQPPGSRATYSGTPGHPVVLGPAQIEAVRQLSGDRGARDLLTGGRLVECADMGSGRDVDTISDLEAIRHEARAGV